MSTVTLRIYDLSNGMARSLSPGFLGKQIDGIWHTGLEVFNTEYYFGGGICASPPGMTPYGTPIRMHSLGSTSKSKTDFQDFLSSIAQRFSMSTYHLLDNNCNNFSDTCSKFLTGQSIPQYILDLPNEAMNSPLGPMIRPIIEQMQSSIQQQSIGHELSLPQASNSAAPESSHISTKSSTSASRSQPYWSTAVTLCKGDRSRILAKLHEEIPNYSDSHPLELFSVCHSLLPLKAFPALDLLRLHVVNSDVVAEKFTSEFESLAKRFVLEEASNRQTPAMLMCLRAAVNAFAHESATRTMATEPYADIVVDVIISGLEYNASSVRKTAALLALNISGAHRRFNDLAKLGEEVVVRMTYALVECVMSKGEEMKTDEARALTSALIVLLDEEEDTVVMAKTFGLDVGCLRNCPISKDEGTSKVLDDLAIVLG